MTKPVYKVETLTGAVSDHIIEKDAISVYSKEIITDGVGHFAFTVPTEKNGDYIYDDIALNDTVKIWYGYDSVSGNPDFIGKVGNISAPLNMESGYVRVISGLSQGEILLRRFKKNKYYTGTNAETIVEEWATDLGLEGDKSKIEADTNQPDIEVKTKSYFDLLRFTTDYWIDAGHQIKKDFYVDVDGDLVWKARPFRSGASVETLTVGKNIMSYRVTRDIEAVKNDITVLGAAEKPLPADKDGYTNTLTNWSASVGTVVTNIVAKVGVSIMGEPAALDDLITFKRTFDDVITIRDIHTLKFWDYPSSAADFSRFRLLAPDTTNYFQTDLLLTAAWHNNEFNLGPDHVYDANENPNGIWTENNSPNWWDIQGIQFDVDMSIVDTMLRIDVLWFYPDRWSDNATNAGSVTSYGQRDMEVTDDKLHSDGDCQKRAETLLYQRKDPPVQIEVTTPRNTNILVGDRIPMTIPAEGISAANYDVVSVAHNHAMQGCITKAIMVNSANIREPVTADPVRMLSVLRRQIRQLGLNERGIS